MGFIIYPPEGTKFGKCERCEMPFIDDDYSKICLLCQITQESENLGLYE
jgi:hypothetical protein